MDSGNSSLKKIRLLWGQIFKIIGLYLIGFLCLGLYAYIDHSQGLSDFLKVIDRANASRSFQFYIGIGLIKLVLLVSGVTIPLTLTIVLIRKQLQKKAV